MTPPRGLGILIPMTTAQHTNQAAAVAAVVTSMATSYQRISFLSNEEGTYIYGSNPGSLERIRLVRNDGSVEAIA